MVRRSLEAANAISAGNSISLTTSATMVVLGNSDRHCASAPQDNPKLALLPFG
jgi:hypothetical protein